MEDIANVDVPGAEGAPDKHLIPRRPNAFDRERGDLVPDDLIGARIVAIGRTQEEIEGGGLVIEYEPVGAQHCVRLTLAFTELGMWVWRRDIIPCVNN